MNKYVMNANLPILAEKIVIGNKYIPILEDGSKEYSVELLPLPDNPDVDTRLSGHADLSIYHYGGNKVLLAPYLRNCGFTGYLLNLGFDITYCSTAQGTQYPFDSALNVCNIGKYRVFNPATAAKEIITGLGNSIAVYTRQGYSKCSVCVVNEDSLITADRHIASAAEQTGINVLVIQPGNVSLSGFEYGFLGGACFKISENCLAFTGNLSNFSVIDRENILEFLDERRIAPVYLSDRPAFDIGGAVAITEK